MGSTTDNAPQMTDGDVATTVGSPPEDSAPPSSQVVSADEQPISDGGAAQADGSASVSVETAVAPQAPLAQEADALSGLAAVEAEIAAEAEQQPESDAEAEEDLPVKSLWQGDLPELLMRIVDARISVWQRLLDIDRRRGELQERAVAREVRDELVRQSRELKRNAPREVLEKALERAGQLLRNPVLKAAPPPDSRDKDQTDQNKLYKTALEMGATQMVLMLQRLKLDAAIPPAALPAAGDEPVLKICRKHQIDAGPLLGWTYYALALFQRLEQCRQKENEHNERLAAAREEDRENKGLMSVFRGGSKEEQVGGIDAGIIKTIRAVRSELQAIEPRMVDLFWGVYEELAWLFADGRLAEDEVPVVRAFLRYGLVSSHPGLVPASALQFILRDCAQDVYEWKNTPQATHVVYADEYIAAIHRRQLTVSPDENLELNERGTDIWKADRVWRQAVICKVRTELYRAQQQALKKRIDDLQAKADKQQQRIEQTRGDPRAKAGLRKLEQEALALKTMMARLRSGLEHIETRVIPKTEQQYQDADQKLGAEAATFLTPEMVVKREARFIRYMCRLSARLKESYPQFGLRDGFEPNRADHHARGAVLEQIRQLEKLDRRIYHQTLVPNKRLDRQISVRMSPVILLAPVRGQMGMSICPRKWDDNGRIVMPLISQRQGVLDTMLLNLLADFRWDCSKEEAGMDWITADALCAAYAAARWNVRKQPERAQKMMGFDPKLKDKPNFRVHYGLFVTSAEQQGRLLFGRSDEVYRVMVKYIGLPPGVQMLKRD